MTKAVIELDKKLNDNEILVYIKDKLEGRNIHELLPEVHEMQEEIQNLKLEINGLRQTISDLAKLVKEK